MGRDSIEYFPGPVPGRSQDLGSFGSWEFDAPSRVTSPGILDTPVTRALLQFSELNDVTPRYHGALSVLADAAESVGQNARTAHV